MEIMPSCRRNGGIHNPLQSYLLNQREFFEVTGGREQGYSVQSQRVCYAVCDHVVAPGDARDVEVLPEAVESVKAVNEALSYLWFFMFRALHSLWKHYSSSRTKTRSS